MKKKNGFTLIETLVAIALLTVAIVAPMALTAKSLATAYYARDQITSFYLAQEAIEAVRAIRDSQILQIAQSGDSTGIDLFGPIPDDNQPFIIDAREGDPSVAIVECTGECPRLQTDGTLYGYDICPDGSCDTYFTRTVEADFVEDNPDEIRVTVTVRWQTGAFPARTFSISEDMYRWVNDDISAP